MSDYKKIYKDAYGIKWDGRKFDIHHIDGNRDNNDLDNLILLPNRLHRELHSIMRQINALSSQESIQDVLKRYIKASLNGLKNWDMDESIPALIETLHECQKYTFMKYVNYRRMDGSKIEEVI